MDLRQLRGRLGLLCVFRGLLSDPVVEGLCAYLDRREDGTSQAAVSAYGEFVSRLYQVEGGDLTQHILRLAEQDENMYIRAVGRGETPPVYMARCVEEELKTLQAVASLTPEELTAGLVSAGPLPRFGTFSLDLPTLYWKRLEEIGRHGYGI